MLKSPYPWFGGKSRVADEIWSRFGVVKNYVEPFFGSGAVLLARPNPDGIETINDADMLVSNFWRAVKADPGAVFAAADWPVNEADLHARHYWLVTKGRERLAAIMGEPEAFDAKIAGWWCWGACSWIGSGWCSGKGPWRWTETGWDNGNAGMGVNRQLPHLGNAGRGVNRKLPHLGDAGRGEPCNSLTSETRGGVEAWINELSARLRHVRVACGDWTRVTGSSVTWRHGLTAVFLDPPYSTEADRTENLYATDCGDVAHDARAWAIEAGKRSDMRICLAGYDGEHAMPKDWTCHAWKAAGGFGSQGSGRGRDNASREVLWFSPACLKAKSSDLFDVVTA